MKCDELNLPELLKSDDENSTDQHSAAEHIESCETCQQHLTQLAADKRQWMEAQSRLSASWNAEDNFDNAVDGRNADGWTEAMAKSLLAPATHPEMLGRLGRFDIERLVGSGGMGIVFKAFDTELNRPVAIKVLAPHLAMSGAARQRFAREARAAAAIINDHVVPIHNVESHSDEPPFLVMQYVAGGSLQQRIDRDGPLTPTEILRVGMQIANGLAAAHSHGLIHRDVKPSNILLDEDVERTLLTDFGLARAEDDACLTRSGFHPGTPHYMSPEQVRGETIDMRSDLFGLGCVLYAMSTGHPPFRADSSYAVMRRITDDSPRPVREINPELPEWLESIVMKLLSKDPTSRFESAEDVELLLKQCLAHAHDPTSIPLPERAETMLPPKPTMRGWINQRILIGIGTALVALIMAIVVVETGKGTITIESKEAAPVPIRITKDGKTVEHLTVDSSGASTRLRAGNYVIEIVDPDTELYINGGTFELRWGGEWVARIKSQPSEHRPTETIGDEANFDQLGSSTIQVRLMGLGTEILSASASSPTVPLVCPTRVDLAAGATHHLLITKVPGRAGVELYATLDLEKITADTGAYLTHNAIPINITSEDVEQVLAGQLLTKAIYFPQSTSPLSTIETIVSSKVDPGIDLIKEAQRRGILIGVLRIGNRNVLSTKRSPAIAFTEPYKRFSVLGPITSHGAPRALDPPTDSQVLDVLKKVLPEKDTPFVLEEDRSNFRVVKEKIADYVDPPRFYPLLGNAQLHHAHYKCTIYFDKTTKVNYPIPHVKTDEESTQVIYIDHNHFHLFDAEKSPARY